MRGFLAARGKGTAGQEGIGVDDGPEDPAEATPALYTPQMPKDIVASGPANGWSALTPEPEELAALRDQVGPGPVVMVNLLKFKQPDGLAAMVRYGQITAPLIRRQKGEVVYAGQAGPVVAGR
jgi:hypothetical protein